MKTSKPKPMYVQQLYTNCLAQATYYLESGNEALIIDPLRDPAPYIELAASRNAKIRFILETHFHADFVSGHLDLARATGATIILGPNANPEYTAHIAEDGEKIPLGNIQVEVLHTPGHTVESSCFLVYDENGKPHSLFSGDTLLVGDVGRPDLMSGNLGPEVLAGKLYDSLEKKIKCLPGEVIVYPGHGQGSACGKHMGKETVTTIDEQKRRNYAMQPMSKKEFIALVTEGQLLPPQYFFTDALLNKTGAPDFDEVIKHGMDELTPLELDSLHRAGATILDTRAPKEFAAAHIPGSINVGIDGDFAVWVGTLYPCTTRFVLVTAPGREKETVARLARIGYDAVHGILAGGIESWTGSGRPVGHIDGLTPTQAALLLDSGKYELLDVRRMSEVVGCRLQNAYTLPLGLFPTELHKLDPAKKYIVCCAGGYRSMIACSLMRSMDIGEVLNLDGGVSRIAKEKPELVTVR